MTSHCPPPIQLAVDLGHLNTLGLPAIAEHFAVLDHPDDLMALQAAGHFAHGAVHVLGGGSNLWLPATVPGLTLAVRLSGKRLAHEDADAWYIAAAAGENWADFVAWTLSQGLPGLENLSLIPGTVGAAPIQNIGAYGVELKDVFHELTAFHLATGAWRRFALDDCGFGYRDSIFKHAQGSGWLITEVTFRLPKAWTPKLDYGDLRSRLGDTSPSPQAVAAAVIATRQSKLPDPAQLGNAGSFFHNPVIPAAQAAALKARFPALVAYPQADGQVKLAAGWLIEHAGWKGKRLGPVGMYEKQALVLVNHGGGTAADVARVVDAVQRDVDALFGVRLNPEPIRW